MHKDDSFILGLVIVFIIFMVVLFVEIHKSETEYNAKCEAMNGEVYRGKGIRFCAVDGKIVNLDEPK